MSLDLSTLKFSTDTTELDTAVKKIETLGKSVEGLASSLGKLDKEVAAANKTQAQANLLTAKAATETAKAATETAKASAITTKAQDQNTAATERLTKATKEKQSVEERQAAITRIMSDGYSRGQASILATAEAMGEATERTAELLKTQRAMQGVSPFDKSLGAATVFANELRVATVASDLYNKDLGFTKNQLQELGREHVRLTEQFKVQGKSLSGLDAEFNKIVQSAQKVTQAENAMAASMKNGQKATIDAGKANAYIENELQKVRFALQANNEELNRGTSNSLVRFENALKKSGLTLDQQRVKIDEYRRSQIELQKTQSANQTDYITRAVGPQITDIIVGLSTGQSPLTVMMQQGGQLRDQFGMMGVAAKDMGDVMRNAMKGMASSAFDTGKAIGTMLVGGIYDASKAVLNFSMNLTGMNSLLEGGKRLLAAQGEEGFKYIGMLTRAGSLITGAFAVGISALAVGLVAWAIATKQVIEEESKLSKALNLTGASLGFTKDSAVAYAASMRDVGATTSQGIEVITAMAKTGIIGADSIRMVTESAVLMEKYAGVAIEDTVKAFEKMKEKPVESMVELARATGTITPETIKLIYELESQGKTAEVASIAMKALADANSSAAKRIQEDLHPLQQLYMGIGDGIKYMWNSFKDVTRSDTSAMLSKSYKRLASYQINPKAHAANIEAERILISQLSAKLRLEGEGVRLRQEQSVASANTAKWEDIKLKNLSSEKKETIEILKIREAGAKAGISEVEIQQQVNAVIAKRPKAKKEAEAKLSDEQKAENKNLEDYIDLMNKSVGLNKDYNNVLDGLQTRKKNGKITEQEYVKAVEELIKQQKFYTDGLTQEEKAQKAAQKAADDHMKLVEEFTKIQTEFAANSLKNQEGIQQENSALKLRGDLLGKTAEEQKKINENYKLQGDISKINAKYDKERLELQQRYLKLQADGFDIDYDTWNAQINESVRQQGEEAKLVWSGVAMNAAESMQKEFDAIKSSITDVIVTALFDGGKAGSKKLRDQVVQAFRNKITVVIDAAVNTLMGSAASSLLGGNKEGGIGTLSNVASLASLGSSIGTVGSQVVTGAMSLTNAIGTIGANATGTGISGLLASNAAYGTAAPTAMSTITGAIGAIPGWGWALMAGVAVAAMLEGGETRSGATYGTGANGKAVKLEGPSGGEIASTQVQKMFNTAKSSIEEMLTGFGSKAVLTGFTAGLESSEGGKGFAFAGGQINGVGFGEYKGRSGGQFAMGDKTAEQAVKDFELNLTQSILEGLQVTEDIPTSIAKLITDGLNGDEVKNLSQEAVNTILNSISTLTKSVNLFNSAMTHLPFEYLKNLSFDTADGLIAAGGGLESLMGNLSGFYDNFYTEAEKTSNLTNATSAAFAKLNITMPAINESTREWYRSEVERLGAMDLSVEANARAYASVLSLQGQVNQLAPAFDDLSSVLAGLKKESSSLQIEMLEAQGRESEAIALRREIETKGFNSAELAAYDYNASLREQISAIGKAKTALESFNQAARSIKSNQDIVNGVVANPVANAQAAVAASVGAFNKSLETTTTTSVDFFRAFNLGSVSDFRDDVQGWAEAFPDTFGKYMVDGLTDPEIAAAYYEMANNAATILKGSSAESHIQSWLTAAAKIKAPDSSGNISVTRTQSGPGLTEAEIRDIAVIIGEIPELNGTPLTAPQAAALDAVWAALAGLTTAQNTAISDSATGTAGTPTGTTDTTAQILQEYNRALLEAQGDSSGLAAFDKAISDAALITAGWTQTQIDAVDAARETTKLTTATSDFNRALLEAQGDTSGLAEFDRKLSDAALITAGWTQTQIDAVDAARNQTKVNSGISTWTGKVNTQSESGIALNRTIQLNRDLANAMSETEKSLIHQYYANEDLEIATAAATQSVETLKSAMDSLESARVSVASAFKSIQDNAKSTQEAVDSAKEAITQGYLGALDQQKQAQETINDLIKRSAEEMRGFADEIREFLLEMATTDIGANSVADQLKALQVDFADTAALARGGDKEAYVSITGKASSLLSAGKEQFSTAIEFARFSSSIGNTLSELATIADGKAGPLAEAVDPMIKAQEELLKANTEVAKWSRAISESGANTSATVMDYAQDWRDATAANQKAQWELLEAQKLTQGVDLKLLDVLGELKALISTYNAANAAVVAAGGTSPNTVVNPVNQPSRNYGESEIANANANAYIIEGLNQAAIRETEAAYAKLSNDFSSIDKIGGLAWREAVASGGDGYAARNAAIASAEASAGYSEGTWNNLHSSLFSGVENAYQELVDSIVKPSSEYLEREARIDAYITAVNTGASLPSFAVGTNSVPSDMLANIHQGERIIPAADNQELMQRLSSPMTQDNSELVLEIQRLNNRLATIESNTASTAGHAAKTARLLDRAMPDGDALATRTAEAI